MRKLLIVGVLGVMVLSLAACGDSGSDAETAALQLKADKYEIEQIEKVFHQAMTTKDIDLMVSLWAPNATLTVGPDLTAAGVDEIRQFWLENQSPSRRRRRGSRTTRRTRWRSRSTGTGARCTSSATS